MRILSLSQLGAYAAVLALSSGCAGAGLGAPSPSDASARASNAAVRSAGPPPSAMAAARAAVQSTRVAAAEALIARLPQGSPKAAAGYAFVSDFPTQTIFVFTPAGNVAGVVTKDLYYPEGLATDEAEHLYVANAGYQNVLVFTKPYQRTPTIYPDSNATPSGVAVTPDGSLIAVMNIQGANDNIPGNVLFYKAGSTTPCATVSNANWGAIFFGAFDSSGDLFIDGLYNPVVGPPLVGEIKGGCNAAGIQTLTTGNSLGKPGGIAVDRNGNVSLQDQSNSAIYTYAPPLNGSLGMPLYTTPLSGVKDSVTFAFAPNEKYVVTPDAVNADVPIYAFPAGGAPGRTFHGPFSEPFGTAVIPTGH